MNFPRLRKETVAAVLVVAGASFLGACSSSKANYKPAPNYNRPATTQSAPSYTAPAAPQYAAPTAPPAQSPGAVACGKGKCG